MILDLDLTLLEEIVTILDANLERLERETHRSEDPDANGLFDRLEYVSGLGFAACQNYIAACAGRSALRKADALQLGPKHRSGEPMVALVNAAANYWKHSPDWDAKRTAPVPRTVGLFASLGVPF